MTPLLMALIAVVALAALSGYALHRAAAVDIPAVLATAARTLPVLTLGAIALVLVDPTEVPSVLRAVLLK
ncbi:hypothetical protein ACIQEY_11745 [Streptomyces parvus]|uniref:hypothetical protein n=1 Tax=Streptomyces TaxID=1883 RepID=UPI001E310E42|nr:hypothetical protein [Streptomyces sp. DH7]